MAKKATVGSLLITKGKAYDDIIRATNLRKKELGSSGLYALADMVRRSSIYKRLAITKGIRGAKT